MGGNRRGTQRAHRTVSIVAGWPSPTLDRAVPVLDSRAMEPHDGASRARSLLIGCDAAHACLARPSSYGPHHSPATTYELAVAPARHRLHFTDKPACTPPTTAPPGNRTARGGRGGNSSAYAWRPSSR